MSACRQPCRRILARQPWTTPQRQWLERIGKQLEQEVVVDREAIDSGQFKAMGGYQRLNRIFQGQLDDILHDLARSHVAGSGISTGTVCHCGPWDGKGLDRVISTIEGERCESYNLRCLAAGSSYVRG